MTDVPDFNPQGPQLVYIAVADHIAARIAAGELRPGTRLVPERDLAEEYGVAYLTVRRAMAELRERGLIVTVHGKGTFVDDAGDGDWKARGNPGDAPTGYVRLHQGSNPGDRAELLTQLTGQPAKTLEFPTGYDNKGRSAERQLLDEFRQQLADHKPVLVGTRSSQPNEPHCPRDWPQAMPTRSPTSTTRTESTCATPGTAGIPTR